MRENMIYHLNVNIGRQLTGIESAAIQRHNLLKEKYQSKLVTIRYNTQLSEMTKMYGLASEDYVNMYDFLQEAESFSEYTSVVLSDIFPEENYSFKRVGQINDYRVYQENTYIAYAHLNEDEQVKYINYFDENGKKKKRQLFDSRGFLSCESLLDENLQIINERYFSPKGITCIEKFYDHEKKNENLLIKVHEKEGTSTVLKQEKELIIFFLRKLLTKKDTVISDKNILVADALIQVSEVGKKIAILHSKHYLGTDSQKGRISGPYREVFSDLDKFDYVVCSTGQQQADLALRFNNAEKFVCIPVGIRKDVRKNRSNIVRKKPIKIGVVARYYEEKRLDHVIKAFKIIHSILPFTELHLYGFGDGRENYKTEKELIRLTNQLNLKEAVKFRGYLLDLDEEYKKMHLILLTSRFEGFCLALLEGISYGIPAISYDINYGPREMIDSGSSGYLVTNSCIDELARKVIHLLSDAKQYDDFSKESFKKSKEFSKQRILDKWEQIIFVEGYKAHE